MKVVICDSPKPAGGTFTFYRNLHAELQNHDCELICASLGKSACAWSDRAPFVEGNCVKIGSDSDETADSARALIAWLKNSEVDVLLPQASVAALTALPFLDPQTRVVARCASITRYAYDLVTRAAPQASAIVCNSRRQYDDLSKNWGVDAQLLRIIENGLAVPAEAPRRTDSPSLRIGYLGRFEHMDKGVLYVPKILRCLTLPRSAWSITLVGEGPDASLLKHELREEVSLGNVSIKPPIHRAKVGEFLGEMDVLLLPSNFEGCPNSMLEAMAVGCVPIASRISGVTDSILQHGQAGLLCTIGDCRDFAGAIESLALNRTWLQKMRGAVRQTALNRFTSIGMAAAYLKLFREVVSSSRKFKRRQDLQNITAHDVRTWHRFVPEGFKSRLRPLLERFRARRMI